MNPGAEHLLGRLLDSHPVFTSAQDRIIGILSNNPPMDFDSLVVESRTPARTALLVVRHLYRTDKVSTNDGRITVSSRSFDNTDQSTTRASHRTAREALIPWYKNYLSAVRHREDPGLLWGQRRLIPQSAVERAAYVLSFRTGFASFSGYVFLGDDDLVSPLVAAAGDSHVTVVDIDKAVVEGAIRIAGELGSQRLSAQHADISAESESNGGFASIVVCDPFPSADGSFEEMFWRKASASLEPGGLLITTVAPSHKPEQYALGALSILPRLGFQLIDLQADFGRYELFEFELATVEAMLLRELGLTSTISHTKSLLTARYIRAVPEENVMNIDFAKWSAATQSHYLTVQAGLQEQLSIVTQRGPARLSSAEKTIGSSGHAHASAAPSTIPVSYLEDQLGDSLSDEEINSLRELVNATNGINDRSGWLDLAVRAIESWNRLRFDAQ